VQIDPPYSIADILAGVVPISITMHLGDATAVQPYTLDTMQEATFPGYVASVFIVSKRQEYQGGYGYLEGSGTFINNSPDTTAMVQSLWLTASNPDDATQTVLLCVLPTIAAEIPPGSRALTVRVGAFQQEEVLGTP
jgi:hypothetical protein